MRGALPRFILAALAPTIFGLTASAQWRRLETKGDVTPANGSVMVFHPPSRRLVQFGGVTPGQEAAEYRLVMAEWDRSPEAPLFWRRHEAKGANPGGRIFPGSAYDAATDRLVIFGGAEDRPQRRLRDDVFVLDHASGATGDPVWLPVKPAGPAPEARSAGRGVFLNAGRDALFFGGCTRGPHGCDFHQDDLWLLSGIGEEGANARWRLVETHGPQPEARSAHTMILCPGAEDILVFGGAAKQSWNDAWLLQIDIQATTGTWEKVPTDGRSPAGRYSHAAACLPAENTLVVFGGNRVLSVASDLWVLRPLGGSGRPRWTQLPNVDLRPAAREHAHLFYDSVTDHLLISGGSGSGQYFSDTWLLDLAVARSSGAFR